MKNLTVEEISERMEACRKKLSQISCIEDLLGVAFADGRSNAEAVCYIRSKLPEASVQNIIKVARDNGF